MGYFTGKTVLITGAARGQGRSHAIRFADEGANVILVDLCGDITGVPYRLPGSSDLAATHQAAEDRGVKAHSAVADVRDWREFNNAVRGAIADLGVPDVVVANAGIFTHAAKVWEIQPEDFQAVIDVDLVGVWHTIRATLPDMIERGHGGSVIATVSSAGIRPTRNVSGYSAAKHGVLGLIRSAALELGPYGIRANCVSPGSTNTPMFRSEAMRRLFVPEETDPSEEEFLERSSSFTPLGNAYVEPDDITEAVLWLASDSARYVTGVNISVDGGSAIR
jgi:SDR family mycofactocin-dependent oxidoreductase